MYVKWLLRRKFISQEDLVVGRKGAKKRQVQSGVNELFKYSENGGGYET